MFPKPQPYDHTLVHQPSDANLSESDIETPTYNSPLKGRHPIDYSKFKTKVCRNYMLGLRCPWEHRCAFSHGPVSGRNASAGAPPPPPPYSAAATESATAPPSYASFVASDSPDASRPPTPPHYPTKFRYDPYTTQGVVFEN